MSILWAGSEIEAFAVVGGATAGTSALASNADPNFSRGYLNLTGTSTRCNLLDFGAIPEAWFHYRWGEYSAGTESSARNLVTFFTSAGQGILRLRQEGTSAPNKVLQYWDGASWVNIGSIRTISTVNGRLFDIQCKIDPVDGRFALYVDGALVSELTGNTDFFSAGVDYVSLQGWGSTNERRVTECIIADEPTLGMRLATLGADGNGANTSWSGSYLDIDEIIVNDSDMISSTTIGEEESFTLANLSTEAAALVPRAVIVSTRARNAPSGPQSFQSLIRTSGTNFTSPSFTGLLTSFSGGYQSIWENNPNTSSPWSPSEINSLEMGAKSDT